MSFHRQSCRQPARLGVAAQAIALPARRPRSTWWVATGLLVLGGVLALSPVHPARASDGHGAPAAHAPATKPSAAPAADPGGHAAPAKADTKADTKAGSRADGKADGHGEPAAAAKPISLDDLSRKLTDRVDKVRERQAKAAATPTLRLTARSPARAHGPAPVPEKPGKLAELTADAHAHATHDIHWAYNGDAGPSHWGELKPEFATCAKGQRQSPIDIRAGLRVDLDPIKFDYHPTPFSVIDNGHTIQANLLPGNGIEVAGRRYELLQFHFHRPSEERINGRQYDMVIHLVHKSADGRLAVVAVLLEQGRNHPAIQAVWNGLPLEKNEELAASVQLDPAALLPDDKRYFTYMGSLTTPPCTEGVMWMVMKQPVGLAPDQISLFSRLYPMNARPIQGGGGRLIKESN